jgi:uncharacterized protein YkwD
MPALAVILVACTPTPQVQPTTATATAGQATCEATSRELNAKGANVTNNARRINGLPRLRPNATLAKAAAAHACDMAQRGQMTHKGSTTTGPGQRVTAQGYDPRITAENIAAGPFSADRVLAEWQASKGHYANIMLPQVNEFGIGHAVGADGKTQYWAAVYAAEK